MASGDDLCFQTATEVISAFRDRTASPVELMDAIIDRCERVNPKISAFTYTFFDRARDQAKQAEQHPADDLQPSFVTPSIKAGVGHALSGTGIYIV